MENMSNLYNQLHQFPTSSVGTSNSSNISEEEVMLASSHPKKRAGRKKFRETRHPVYRGVRKRNSGKWVCEVRQPNKKSRIWLGTYETVEMAARAHDVAAIALRGRSACLNFADSTWRLPVPASGNVTDIQRAAAEAAEMFGPYHNNQPHDDVVSAENNVVRQKREDIFMTMPENAFYNDDQGLFDMPDFFNDMPVFFNDMAEGMMVAPPPQLGGAEDYGGDDMDFATDVSLWSYLM